MWFLTVVLCADKWKDYPIYVTAYSYLFGAVLMGVASVIYTAATGKWSEFIIPEDVRIRWILVYKQSIYGLPSDNNCLFL